MEISELLHRLTDVSGSPPQYSAKCPAHDDKKASLSIKEAEDGKILLHCHAHCTLEAICEALGITKRDIMGNSQAQTYKKTTAKQAFSSSAPKKEVARYNYCDVDGRLLAQKIRYEPKVFSWYNPNTNQWSRKGLPPLLYKQELIKDNNIIYIVEGEKDADNINSRSRDFGGIAVSPPDGADPKKWKTEYNKLLKDKVVYIIPDNDDIGESFSKTIAESLVSSQLPKIVKILYLKQVFPELPEKGDISDALSLFQGKEFYSRIAHLIATSSEYLAGAEGEKNYILTDFSQIDAKRARYLFPPYVPRGKITIVAGISGSGKTWWVLHLAALVSRGEPLFKWEDFDESKDPGRVIYQTKENDAETDLRPRLDKLHANLKNVLVIEDKDQSGEYNPVTLGDDRLYHICKEYHPDMIVFDPIQSYLGANIDMNNAAAVRPILDKLQDIAQTFDVAIILIAHMNKKTDQGALDRILGSSDFRNAARSILIVGADPNADDFPNTRIVAHAKNSLGIQGESIAYHIDNQQGVIVDGTSELTDDEIIVKPLPGHSPRRGSPKSDAAIELIHSALGEKGYCEAKKVIDAAAVNGIDSKTVQRVRASLLLQSVKIGYGNKKRTWWVEEGTDIEEFRKARLNDESLQERSEQMKLPT